MAENTTQDEDMAVVKRACDTLMEHFDNVQIFVTRMDPEQGGAVNINFGKGNVFARVGHVQAWLEKERGRNMEAGRQEYLDNEDDS